MLFLAGLFVGSVVGFATAALCIAAKRGDKMMGINDDNT